MTTTRNLISMAGHLDEHDVWSECMRVRACAYRMRVIEYVFTIHIYARPDLLYSVHDENASRYDVHSFQSLDT